MLTAMERRLSEGARRAQGARWRTSRRCYVGRKDGCTAIASHVACGLAYTPEGAVYVGVATCVEHVLQASQYIDENGRVMPVAQFAECIEAPDALPVYEPVTRRGA